MKRLLTLTFLLFVIAELRAQTVYKLSFDLPDTTHPVTCDAFFIDFNDGNGKIRLRFASPVNNENILADIDIKEEAPDINSTIFNSNWVNYKLQPAKYIEGTDPGIKLPKYVCFKKEAASGLYQPFGVSDDPQDCKVPVARFTDIVYVEQKDLTKELVLTYFKPYDMFYRNLFVNNNSKALTTSERNVKLFLLFVANVTDAKIGTADRKNMNDVIAFFGKVKQFLGISEFVYDTIAGADNYSRKNVEYKVKTFLTPGPNDIVVFYYSGHGFRKERDGRPGPYLDMVVDYKRQKYLDEAISLEDILVTIRNKGARLNLILSDCCNAKVTDSNPMVDAVALAGKKGGFGINWSTQNCRDLFLNATPTTIMATAASPNQLAISNPVFGSYFTAFFINAMETHLGFYKTKVTWENVFDQTKIQTETKASRTWCNEAKTEVCNRQRPYVNIMNGRF